MEQLKDRTWYINREDCNKIVQHFAENRKGKGFYCFNRFEDNILMRQPERWQELVTEAHKEQLENFMRAYCVELGYPLTSQFSFDRKFDVVTIDGNVVYKNGVWIVAAGLSVEKNTEFKTMPQTFETPVKIKGLFRDGGGMSKANSTSEQRRGIIGLLMYNQTEYDVTLSPYLMDGKYSGIEALRYIEAQNIITSTMYHEDVVKPLTYEEALFKIQQLNTNK